jgi:hypothetical protein
MIGDKTCIDLKIINIYIKNTSVLVVPLEFVQKLIKKSDKHMLLFSL